MAGRGPAPDPHRLRHGKPARGERQPSPDGGWQHELPVPPPVLSSAAQEVWTGWFRSWWAGHWTPDDLPTLRIVIRPWDRVDRGGVKRAAELRQWLDSMGVTPKGQQDRRWARPLPPHPETALERIRAEAARRRAGPWPPVPSRFKTIPPEQRR